MKISNSQYDHRRRQLEAGGPCQLSTIKPLPGGPTEKHRKIVLNFQTFLVFFGLFSVGPSWKFLCRRPWIWSAVCWLWINKMDL